MKNIQFHDAEGCLMSMKLMAKVFDLEDIDLTSLELLVLLKLAENTSDETGECWPSYNYLARKCRCSRSTTLRVCKSLEKKLDFFTKKTRRVNNTNNLTNIYVFDFDKLDRHELDRLKNKLMGGVTQTQGGVTQILGGVTQTLGGSITQTLGGVTQKLGGGVTQTPRTYQLEPVNETTNNNRARASSSSSAEAVIESHTQKTAPNNVVLSSQKKTSATTPKKKRRSAPVDQQAQSDTLVPDDIPELFMKFLDHVATEQPLTEDLLELLRYRHDKFNPEGRTKLDYEIWMKRALRMTLENLASQPTKHRTTNQKLMDTSWAKDNPYDEIDENGNFPLC